MKELKNEPRTLLVGIGNSGRSDDGLGWKFIEEIGNLGYDFLNCEFRYQLQVEDALLVSEYDVVVFVDASQEKLTHGFEMMSCIASDCYFFTTHAQMPGAILFLTNRLYNKFPKAYTLAISGNEWELDTSLSTEAKHNLQAAVNFFVEEFLPTIQPALISL